MAGSCLQEVVLSVSLEDDSAHLWDLRTATTLVSYRPAATQGSIATVGKDLFVVPQPGKASLHVFGWRRDQPHSRCSLPEKLTTIAASADGAFMIGGGATGRLYLWEVPNGAMLRTWEGHYRSVTCACFTGDGSHIVTGSEDSLVRVWSLAQIIDYSSGQQAPPAAVHTWNLHTLPVTSVACGSGGASARILSGSMDRSMRVWHIPTGVCLAMAQFPTPVTSVALHPCEETVYCGGSDGDVYAVDLVAPVPSSTGTPALTAANRYVGHTGGVLSLSLSFDGSLLVSSSRDGTAKVWDCASGQALKTFTGHSKGPVSCVRAMLRPPNLLDGPHLKIQTPFALLSRRPELEDPASAHFAGPARSLPVMLRASSEMAPAAASGPQEASGGSESGPAGRGPVGDAVRLGEEAEQLRGEVKKWRKVANDLHGFCVEAALVPGGGAGSAAAGGAAEAAAAAAPASGRKRK